MTADETHRVTSYGGLPDPDWYLDHVLVHAEPGRFDAVPVGPVAVRRRWWQDRARALQQRCDPVVDLALEQGFVVGTDQLSAQGWPPHQLRRQVRRGTWTAVARGVASPVTFAGGADPFEAARRRHSLLATGAVLRRREAVVSGRSSAVLHGLPVLTLPPMPELTARTPTTLGHRRRAHLHGAQLTAADVSSWLGAPCTTVARTVVDLARHDRRDGLITADAALHEGLLRMADLDPVLERCAGWPGIRRARDVLALAMEAAESPLESLLRLALHDSGFPAPRPQFVIDDPERGRNYRVDLCWPAARLVLEADGRVKYRPGDQDEDERWREKRRETRLRALGFRVERVLWDDVTRYWPDTEARIRRELRTGFTSPA